MGFNLYQTFAILGMGGGMVSLAMLFFGTAVALVVVSLRGIHPLTLFLRYIIHSQCKLWLLLWTFCTYCVNFQYKCRYNHKSVKNKHALSLVKSHFKPFAHLQKRKCHKLRVFWRNLFASKTAVVDFFLSNIKSGCFLHILWYLFIIYKIVGVKKFWKYSWIP